MLKKKEQWCVTTIKSYNNRKALGYESTLDFNLGLICGWKAAKIVSAKFAKELLDNFANENFDDEYDQLENKYGRILC